MWLSDNDALLQSEINTSSYLNMHASWKLNKPELFGPGVSLGGNVIHVLVVIPPQVLRQRGVLAPTSPIPKFKQFDNRKKCLAEYLLDQWKPREVHNIPVHLEIHEAFRWGRRRSKSFGDWKKNK
ncbi:hypothetical protein V7S43_014192 [Phytophthora oleae]|uniref:Uncharacterized protein n=1 Tax=Phytophthora oleae TaxID=2107226 RepID=A0ABD3F5R2_9STRA